VRGLPAGQTSVSFRGISHRETPAEAQRRGGGKGNDKRVPLLLAGWKFDIFD